MLLYLFRYKDSERPLFEMLTFLNSISGWKTVRASWTGEFQIQFEYKGKKLTAFLSYYSRVSNGDTNREKALANVMAEELIRRKISKPPKLPPDDYYKIRIYEGYFDAPPFFVDKNKGLSEEYISELHGFYNQFSEVFKWARIDSIS